MVSFLALATCASRTPAERERAVSKLPAHARLIAAADGPALAPFRPVIDAARPLVPRTLDCVLDAAMTSEAVAVGVTPGVGATVVIVTRAHVARCTPLSRIADDTFVATVGAGSIADSPAASPLGDARWARAKKYLVDDPIAFALAQEDMRALAAAQADPLDAWLAIDAADVPAVERAIRGWIERQRTTSLQPFVDKLAIETRGNQLLVRSTALDASELASAVAELLRSLDAPAPRPAATPFTCPTLGGDIVRCTDGTRLVVRSLAGALRGLVVGQATPVIAGGDVIGIRLGADARMLLRRGDIILGLDGHRITSAAQLRDLAGHVERQATLAVRRDGIDTILELSELQQ